MSNIIGYWEAAASVSDVTQQRAHLTAIYEQYDSDSDGKVSFSQVYQSVRDLGAEYEPDDIDILFAEQDEDQDGLLDFDEWAALVIRVKSAEYEQLRGAEVANLHNTDTAENIESQAGEMMHLRSADSWTLDTEHALLFQFFRQFDANYDSVLDAGEIGKALKLFGLRLSPEHLSVLLKACGADDAGTVDFNEWIHVMVSLVIYNQLHPSGTSDEAPYPASVTELANGMRLLLLQAFNQSDSRRDGHLSLSDVMQSLEMFDLRTSSEHTMQIIIVFDVDGDGHVDFKEWLQIMRFRQLFERFDSEVDSNLTLEEVIGALIQFEVESSETNIQKLMEFFQSKDRTLARWIDVMAYMKHKDGRRETMAVGEQHRATAYSAASGSDSLTAFSSEDLTQQFAQDRFDSFAKLRRGSVASSEGVEYVHVSVAELELFQHAVARLQEETVDSRSHKAKCAILETELDTAKRKYTEETLRLRKQARMLQQLVDAGRHNEMVNKEEMDRLRGELARVHIADAELNSARLAASEHEKTRNELKQLSAQLAHVCEAYETLKGDHQKQIVALRQLQHVRHHSLGMQEEMQQLEQSTSNFQQKYHESVRELQKLRVELTSVKSQNERLKAQLDKVTAERDELHVSKHDRITSILDDVDQASAQDFFSPRLVTPRESGITTLQIHSHMSMQQGAYTPRSITTPRDTTAPSSQGQTQPQTLANRDERQSSAVGMKITLPSAIQARANAAAANTVASGVSATVPAIVTRIDEDHDRHLSATESASVDGSVRDRSVSSASDASSDSEQQQQQRIDQLETLLQQQTETLDERQAELQRLNEKIEWQQRLLQQQAGEIFAYEQQAQRHGLVSVQLPSVSSPTTPTMPISPPALQSHRLQRNTSGDSASPKSDVASGKPPRAQSPRASTAVSGSLRGDVERISQLNESLQATQSLLTQEQSAKQDAQDKVMLLQDRMVSMVDFSNKLITESTRIKEELNDVNMRYFGLQKAVSLRLSPRLQQQPERRGFLAWLQGLRRKDSNDAAST
eukprot:TRINITY_DN1156_c0_g1_i1.p1 TRINITY_DN1156_c0_g1~~TRINITY_DN1156_c0_g1_i1.p1  ORF type:complete len:1080 (+),score=259.03 TRINITY_DN1156_c0_g1_i1:159-3242(+)